MELKPGYKQTEVGVVPEDWEVALLQDACRESITYGIVQCGPHVENGIPYIRVSDMDRAELDVDRMLRTSRSIAARFVRSAVSEGDLVYALRGRLGEVRQIPREIAGANLTQGTARLAPNERLTGGYLLWAMRNPGSLAQAATEAKGTTFREITLADLRKVRILVPARAEQEAIAEALSDAEALIGSLEQLVTKKRQVKQGAMQELLTGKKRLPGFSGEWKVTRLKDLGSTFGGLTGKSKSDFGHGGARYITFMNIMTNVVIDCGRFERVSVPPTESQNRVMKGDLFFNGSSETPEEVGMCAVLVEDVETVFLSRTSRNQTGVTISA